MKSEKEKKRTRAKNRNSKHEKSQRQKSSTITRKKVVGKRRHAYFSWSPSCVCPVCDEQLRTSSRAVTSIRMDLALLSLFPERASSVGTHRESQYSNSRKRDAVDAVIAATCHLVAAPRTPCSIQPRPCWRARLLSCGGGTTAAIRARTMGPRGKASHWGADCGGVAVDIAQLHIAYHLDTASQV